MSDKDVEVRVEVRKDFGAHLLRDEECDGLFDAPVSRSSICDSCGRRLDDHCWAPRTVESLDIPQIPFYPPYDR